MTYRPSRLCPRNVRALTGILLGGAFVLACSAPVPKPTGAAYEFDSAQDMFKRGRFDRALEFSEGPATASPPNAFTERARVLRVAILSGHVKAYKELADAYKKGTDTTKNPRVAAEFNRLRGDYLQFGSGMALQLGEMAHRLTAKERIAKELTLEAPYPSKEGPPTLPSLTRVMEGGSLEPGEQESLVRDALLKGVDDALAEMVGVDRAKARSVLDAGPVKISGVDFALYLGKQLLEGASLFDRKHMQDSSKFYIFTGEVEEAGKAALALLKDNPNTDKEKAVKKLQDDVKTAVKNL